MCIILFISLSSFSLCASHPLISHPSKEYRPPTELICKGRVSSLITNNKYISTQNTQSWSYMNAGRSELVFISFCHVVPLSCSTATAPLMMSLYTNQFPFVNSFINVIFIVLIIVVLSSSIVFCIHVYVTYI